MALRCFKATIRRLNASRRCLERYARMRDANAMVMPVVLVVVKRFPLFGATASPIALNAITPQDWLSEHLSRASVGCAVLSRQ
jgi:hypothetical protein